MYLFVCLLVCFRSYGHFAQHSFGKNRNFLAISVIKLYQIFLLLVMEYYKFIFYY